MFNLEDDDFLDNDIEFEEEDIEVEEEDYDQNDWDDDEEDDECHCPDCMSINRMNKELYSYIIQRGDLNRLIKIVKGLTIIIGKIQYIDNDSFRLEVLSSNTFDYKPGYNPWFSREIRDQHEYTILD